MIEESEEFKEFYEDEGVMPMPTACVKFKCNKAPLEVKGKFIVCTKCGCSYGEIEERG